MAAKTKYDHETIYKASKINRTLLVVTCIFVTWNFFNVRLLQKSTVEMNSKFVTQKIAVDANTKQLLDFMTAWHETQQQLSDWMSAQRTIQDKISKDNPRLKIPKPPPFPSSLPTPKTDFTPEPRPSPVIIRKKVYITRKAASPTPKPFVPFWKNRSQTR